MTSARLADSDIRAVFDVLDANGNGVMDRHELRHALAALGWAAGPADLDDALHAAAAADPAPTTRRGVELPAGKLTFEQFAAFVRANQRPVGSPEEVAAAFSVFDAAGTGAITAADLARVGAMVTGAPVPPAVLADMMAVADRDRDGAINLADFAATVGNPSAAGTRITTPVLSIARPERPPPLPFDSGAPRCTTKLPVSARRASAARRGTAPAKASTKAPAKASAKASAKTSPKAAPAPAAPAPAAPAPAAESEVTIGGAKVLFAADGTAGPEALRAALEQLGYGGEALPEAALGELVAEADGDGDGRLTRDEVCRVFVSLGEQVEGF